ncbi:MAG TPA: hypothetical protein VMU53_16210 [Candidatus Sulfotelmatobacter sp.]|nr:hypothetical protein [Candidatus Sulfotelmatobacter sp.]
MFLPHLHSHFSNRLFLALLAVLLFVAATSGRHSRPHFPALLDAIRASHTTPHPCSP